MSLCSVKTWKLFFKKNKKAKIMMHLNLSSILQKNMALKLKNIKFKQKMDIFWESGEFLAC